MFRRDRNDKGNLAVLESMIVGFIVIAGVASVATMHEPTATSSAARLRMAQSSADVLQIMAELSAQNSAVYGSRLEETITAALQGNPTPLRENLTSLLPPGTEFEVYLDNGQGGEVPIVTTGETPGTESVTNSRLMNPHWSYLVVQPLVENVSAIVPLAPITNLMVPPITNTLTLQGILVRNSYVDQTSPVSLTFQNSGHAAFATTLAPKHVRTSNALQPEFVANLTNGYNPGFAVPYNLATSAGYLAGVRSTTDLTQAQGNYKVTHNVAGAAQPRNSVYSVHPKFALAATVSQTLLGINGTTSQWSTDRADPQYQPGTDTVTFSWNYNSLAAQVLANARTIRIYNPAGGLILQNISVNSILTGTYQFPIPKSSLWGTYVAELELSLKDPATQTKFYVVHQLTYFNVNPPTGYSWNQQHVPPTYRVILNSWLGDWGGGGSALGNTKNPGCSGSCGSNGLQTSLHNTPNPDYLTAE